MGGLSRRRAPPNRNGWSPAVRGRGGPAAEIDVLIDFSAPEGTVDHAAACASAGVPMVCGTTGLDAAQMAALRAAASASRSSTRRT